MDYAFMLKVSVVLLCLTALGGLVMGFLRLDRELPPSWLAMAHGLLAGSGLTLLVYAAWAVGLPTMMWVGLVVLALAAALGICMNLAFHARLLPLPVSPLVLHGFIGVIGLALIALGAFGGPPTGP